MRFRHALLRDAAYEALPYRRRRQLHARAGELIERRAGAARDQQAELLAIHFHVANRWAETWHYAAVAGEQALSRAAPTEAAGFFHRALDAGRAGHRDPVELARIARRQADALRLAGHFEAAGAAFVVSRRHARGHPLLEGQLCLEIGRLRERSKHQTQALRWFTAGMKTLEGREGREADVLRAQIWLSRAVVRLHRGHMAEGVRCAGYAAEIALRAGDRHTQAKAYTVLHWAHTEMASPERAGYRDFALPVFEELEDYEWQGKTLNNLGIDAYWSGRWDEAVAFYERGRAMLERVGDVVEAGVLRNNIAEIRSDQGRLEEAEEQLREVLPTFRGAGFHLGVGLVLSNLGRVATRAGDVERAAELFAQSRETLLAIGAEAVVIELDTREAERLVAAGETQAALRLAGAIRATTAGPGSPARAAGPHPACRRAGQAPGGRRPGRAHPAARERGDGPLGRRGLRGGALAGGARRARRRGGPGGRRGRLRAARAPRRPLPAHGAPAGGQLTASAIDFSAGNDRPETSVARAVTR